MSSNLTPSAKNLSPIDAAWLAGYFDGDGCICLEKNSHGFRRPRLVIDSTDRELLDHVLEIVGDGTTVEKKSYSSQHRMCWSWRVVGYRRSVAILKQIVPFMHCAAKIARVRMLLDEWIDSPVGMNLSMEKRAAKSAFEEKFLAIGANRGKRIHMPRPQITV